MDYSTGRSRASKWITRSATTRTFPGGRAIDPARYYDRNPSRINRSANSGRSRQSIDSCTDWRSANSGTDSSRGWKSANSDKDWRRDPSPRYRPKSRRNEWSNDPFIAQVKNLAKKGALMSPSGYRSWRNPLRNPQQKRQPYRGGDAKEPISPWSESYSSMSPRIWQNPLRHLKHNGQEPISPWPKTYNSEQPEWRRRNGRSCRSCDRAFSACVTVTERPKLNSAYCQDGKKNDKRIEDMETYFVPTGGETMTRQETKSYINSSEKKSSVNIELLQPGTPMTKGGKGEDDATRLNLQLKVGLRKSIDLFDVPCVIRKGTKGIQLGTEVLQKLGLDPNGLLIPVFNGRKNHLKATIGDESSTGAITFLGGEEFNASAEEMEVPLDTVKDEVRTGEWSKEEDLQMWRQILLYGNQWALMAANLPGRHADQVKHRAKELLYKYAGIPRRVGNMTSDEVRKRNKNTARIRLGSLMEIPKELGTPVKRRNPEPEVATNSQRKSRRAHKKTRRTEAPRVKSIKKVKVLLKNVQEVNTVKRLEELTAMIQQLTSQGILKLPPLEAVEECSPREVSPGSVVVQEEVIPQEAEQAAQGKVSEQVTRSDTEDNKNDTEEVKSDA